MVNTPVTDTDNYISQWPPEVQKRLKQMRHLILKLVPKAKEKISYGMPAFDHYGPLVYFAAYKNHIGFYAIPSAHETFKKELRAYKQGKGSVQFPHDKPLPYGLIEKMMRFRVEENEQKAATKR